MSQISLPPSLFSSALIRCSSLPFVFQSNLSSGIDLLSGTHFHHLPQKTKSHIFTQEFSSFLLKPAASKITCSTVSSKSHQLHLGLSTNRSPVSLALKFQRPVKTCTASGQAPIYAATLCSHHHNMHPSISPANAK